MIPLDANKSSALCDLYQFVPCVMILIIRRCVVWSFFFVSSVVVNVSIAWRSDGVTVASKSFKLSLSGYIGDVNSCLWLVNVAHAHLMRCSNANCAAFLEVMS